MSKQQTFRANAERVGEGETWLVSCLTCGCEIGTMNADLLRQAVMITCHKGGVMCPLCRSLSCEDCGVVLSQWERAKGRVCAICELERTVASEEKVCTHGFQGIGRKSSSVMKACPSCEMQLARERMGAGARYFLSSCSYLFQQRGSDNETL